MTRPTEDFVIAKLTLEERLASLNPHQKRALILHIAGYRFGPMARALGTTEQNQSIHWNKALKQVSE